VLAEAVLEVHAQRQRIEELEAERKHLKNKRKSLKRKLEEVRAGAPA